MTGQPQATSSSPPQAWRSVRRFCSSKERVPALVVASLLAAVTFVAYWPALSCGFVNFDDPEYVTSNAHVQRGRTFTGVKWAFTTGHASNWHPFTWLSLMLDVQLFGAGAKGFHFTNVLLHAANSIILFLFLRSCSGTMWRSAAVAALFALHPLHVESVAWISERKDVLSALFGLLALWSYSLYAKGKTETNQVRGRVYYILAVVLFAAGLMSKPMLVTLPFVMLLLDYWPLHRFDLATKNESIAGMARLFREKIPFFILSGFSCVITFVVQRKGRSVQLLESFPLDIRIQNAFVACARYLEQTFWPVDLACLYPHPGEWHWAQVLLSALIVAGVSAVAIWLRSKHRFVPAGWLWFVGMLVPVIGIVQVGVQSMADRYTYLPLIGVFIVLVWEAEVLGRERHWAAITITIILAALLACVVQTRHQISFWREGETLFRRAIAVTENNPVAYNNLGLCLLEKGKTDEAIECYQKALQLNPNHPDAHYNYGNTLVRLGRVNEGIEHYRRAVRFKPYDAQAYNNLGYALALTGHLDEALTNYHTALRIDPSSVEAMANLGSTLMMRKEYNKAITCFQTVLKAKPDEVEVHGNLANALAVVGNYRDAIGHYQFVVQRQSTNAAILSNLGAALLAVGRAEEARRYLKESSQINPNHPKTHYRLGVAWAQLGKLKEAAEEFREALRLQPDFREAEQSLRRLESETSR
jgi:protein O-mannosyl-transferase